MSTSNSTTTNNSITSSNLNHGHILDRLYFEQCIWNNFLSQRLLPQTRSYQIRSIRIHNLTLPESFADDHFAGTTAGAAAASLIACIRFADDSKTNADVHSPSGESVCLLPKIPFAVNPVWDDIDIRINNSDNNNQHHSSYSCDIILCLNNDRNFEHLISFPFVTSSSSSHHHQFLRLGRNYDEVAASITAPGAGAADRLLPPNTLILQFDHGLYALLNRVEFLHKHVLQRAAALVQNQRARRRAEKKHAQDVHRASNKITYSTAFADDEDDDHEDEDETKAAAADENLIPDINSSVAAYRHELLAEAAAGGGAAKSTLRSIRRLFHISRVFYYTTHQPALVQLRSQLDSVLSLSERRYAVQRQIERHRCQCADIHKKVQFLSMRLHAIEKRGEYLRHVNAKGRSNLDKSKNILEQNTRRHQLSKKIVAGGDVAEPSPPSLRQNLLNELRILNLHIQQRQQFMVYTLMQLFDMKRIGVATNTNTGTRNRLFRHQSIAGVDLTHTTAAKWSICGFTLPDLHSWSAAVSLSTMTAASEVGGVDDEKSRVAALTHLVHVLQVLSTKILQRAILPFPVRLGGFGDDNDTLSCSSSSRHPCFIYDFVTPTVILKKQECAGNVNEYLLNYLLNGKSSSSSASSVRERRQRFLYALYLLNLNILQLRYDFGLHSWNNTLDALDNLCSFLLLKFQVPYQTSAAISSNTLSSSLSSATTLRKSASLLSFIGGGNHQHQRNNSDSNTVIITEEEEISTGNVATPKLFALAAAAAGDRQQQHDGLNGQENHQNGHSTSKEDNNNFAWNVQSAI